MKATAKRKARSLAVPLVALALATAGVTGCDGGGGGSGSAGLTVYENENYGGWGYFFTPPTDDADYSNNPASGGGTINDKVSSVRNISAYWVLLWEHPLYSGDAVCMAPVSAVVDLGDFNVNPLPQFPRFLEDRVSSHQFRTSRPTPSSAGGPCDAYIPTGA